MGNIAASDVRALFTKKLIDVYQDGLKPTSFLRSMAKVEVSPTKEVSIQVERMGEFVAVDVIRGTEGQRNTFSKSTEKIFVPPLYREYFDATELDLYDRVLGSQGDAQAPLFAALLNDVSRRLGSLQDKIDRATELQWSQVLNTGIVTLRTGDAIDFRRKAASFLVANSGGVMDGYWDGAGNPMKQIEQMCIFLRQIGKSADSVFRLLMGQLSLSALLENAKFLTRQNLFNMALDAVVGPVRNSVGATYHGTLTCGAYKVELWCYPQSYDTKDPVTGVVTATPYLTDKKVTLVPANPRFITAYAAVPQLIGQPGQLPVPAQYKVGDFIDERNAKHDFDIQSAPLAIPVGVDQIVTLTTLA